ncbi:uncharacterized protein LOC143463343 [Clavelina lepadiformis]|uniref:uncharacterized protein LOC143463343 n=1 Tax=Clavelina lepadiformis TaxID=159417 RepID=UPI0040430D42
MSENEAKNEDNLEMKDVVYSNDDVFPNNEECENLSLVADPSELYKKFQEFCKANGSRNQSTEFCGEEEHSLLSSSICSDYSNHSATENNDIERNDLYQRNKSLREQNNELNEKMDQLMRQLENVEDENKQQRSEIIIHEKEMKTYNDLMQELQVENIQAQADLAETKEKVLLMENNIRRMKADELDLRAMNRNLQDQNDHLSNDLNVATMLKFALNEENSTLKERCEGLEADVDLKNKELDEKLQLYQDLREQTEEFKSSVQILREEKDTLLDQVREIQMEVSIYQQSYHKSPDNISPLKSPTEKHLFSLQSEIAEAEKNNESLLHCLDDNQLTVANPSMNEMLQSMLMARSGASTPLNVSPRCFPSQSQNIENIFFSSAVQEAGTQTSQHEIRETFCQTDEEFASLEESSTLITIQELCTELKADLNTKEKELEITLEILEHNQKQKQCLTRQLEDIFSSKAELERLNERYLSEISQLNDINEKLCTSKIHQLYDDIQQLTSGNECDEELPEGNLMDITLLDALNLENMTCLNTKTAAKSVLPFMEYDWVGFQNTELSSERDQVILHARLQVLKKCKSLLCFALLKQMEAVREVARECLHGCHLPSSSDHVDLAPSKILSQSISAHLMKLNDLSRRVAACSQSIGSLEAEIKLQNCLKLFVKGLSSSSQRISKLQQDLVKLCDINGFVSQVEEIPTVENSIDCLEIVEVSPELFQTVIFSSYMPDWMKCVLDHELCAEVVQNGIQLSYYLQNKFTISRRKLLCFIFLFCALFSISPVDYQVNSVY